MNRPVRTRFAPSPTGYLHVGGARTALYSWAYARKHGGTFILRIEDTDIERSTQASIDAILDGMTWLGLDWDEGPFYQMQRLARYTEVAQQLIKSGHAYWCYASKEELDALRSAQRARGEKPRYDGRWRPENAKGKTPPADVKPILRFRNPDDGAVAWDDLVKGRIEIANAELDDLVLLRADGVPTYNFGVVVDDLDMGISHCIRGDDHVNNTPRQINIYRALGAPLPAFAHVPMILGSDGERLSKRHGAVSVMQYAEDGYLPEALLNYLARLGWSHGNDEVFSLEQFVDWFDLEHISRSPAQFNPEKLAWLDQQHLKGRDDKMLAEEVAPRLAARGIGTAAGPSLEKVVALYKDRVSTLNELADAVEPFYVEVYPGAELLAQYVTDAAREALRGLRTRLETAVWEKAQLNQALKDVVAARGMKLPQLAIPLRVVLTGQPQTPSIDAVLEAFGRDAVLARLGRHV
ncbi:MAG: Glutamate--tRNA ligase [Rhodocyclaceae bacterium]|nr:MAG: glutamate--tRNA ligase [Rhodocyclaceae bacterium]MBV6408083.1 Glutamate--tRNA ligase [Rhodocyclaceae bacterium]CAG0933288.1 glutamyl-tRNA synthetase [Rhodocyclaceae bacterium]